MKYKCEYNKQENSLDLSPIDDELSIINQNRLLIALIEAKDLIDFIADESDGRWRMYLIEQSLKIERILEHLNG